MKKPYKVCQKTHRIEKHRVLKLVGVAVGVAFTPVLAHPESSELAPWSNVFQC